MQVSDVLLSVTFDASFLIDICKINKKIFSYYTKRFNKVIILDVIFDEVKSLTLKDCKHYNLILQDVDTIILEQAGEAINKTNSSLSFNDYVLFYYCLKNKIRCITNDKRLKNEFDSNNVSAIWEHQSILELYENGIITKSTAEEIGKKLRKVNPRITYGTLYDFLEKLNEK